MEQIIKILNNKEQGAYVRFGDGELNILHGRDGRNYKYTQPFASGLSDIFSIYCDNFIIGMPFHSKLFGGPCDLISDLGFPKYRVEGLFMENFSYCIGRQIHSAVFLHHYALHHHIQFISFMKFLNTFESILVTNKENHLLNKFILNTYSIISSEKNSFDSIDRIEKDVLNIISSNQDKYYIIFLAAGGGVKPLIPRLYQSECSNFFIFDLGSVMEINRYNESQRTWLSKRPKSYWENILYMIGNDKNV